MVWCRVARGRLTGLGRRGSWEMEKVEEGVQRKREGKRTAGWMALGGKQGVCYH